MDYEAKTVSEITTVHSQLSYTIDGIEYRSVPAWLISEHKMLKYVIVSKDAKVLYHNMLGFCENANFRQLWTTPEIAAELGYDMNSITKDGFLWIGKSKDGYFLADRNVTAGDKVALKKVIAATWLSRNDAQTWIGPLDDNKFNVKADNLKWFTQSEYKEYMKEFRKKKPAIPFIPAPNLNPNPNFFDYFKPNI